MGGEALISRLVIPMFKPKPDHWNWPQIAKELQISKDNPGFEADIGAAFYDYLVSEYEVIDGFETDRL
jgi:hypothetical protein